VVLLLVHSITRKTAALAGLIFLLGPGTAQAQRPANPADEAWPERPSEAARLYELQVNSGQGGDTTVFNAGSAALVAADTALAGRALAQASNSIDPGIRFKALYNLGLLHHYLARIDSMSAEVHLQNAIGVYREALLLRPSDEGAKWNLELAIQDLPSSDGQSGDEEENEPQPEQNTDQSPSGLSRSQAEQILNSIMQEERDTRERLGDRNGSSREILRDKEW
jgi:hypothetical protein